MPKTSSDIIGAVLTLNDRSLKLRETAPNNLRNIPGEANTLTLTMIGLTIGQQYQFQWGNNHSSGQSGFGTTATAHTIAFTANPPAENNNPTINAFSLSAVP